MGHSGIANHTNYTYYHFYTLHGVDRTFSKHPVYNIIQYDSTYNNYYMIYNACVQYKYIHIHTIQARTPNTDRIFGLEGKC